MPFSDSKNTIRTLLCLEILVGLSLSTYGDKINSFARNEQSQKLIVDKTIIPLKVEKTHFLPTIIPAPKYVKYTHNSFILNTPLNIYLTFSGELSRSVKKTLDNYIKRRCNISANILSTNNITEKCRGIIFTIRGKSGFIDNLIDSRGGDYSRKINSDEGYWILADSDRVIVCGASAKGCWFGLQTLKQLFYRDGENIYICGVLIRDYPDLKFRGWHINRVINGEEKHFKRLIDTISMLKFNTIIMETDECFPFKCVPQIFAPYGCGREGWRWRIKYANSHNIEVIPHLQLFSHCYYLTHPRNKEYANDPFFRKLGENPKAKGKDRPWNYCPRNPVVRKLTKQMLEEIIEFFKPKYIHVGMDELNVGVLGVCKRCRNIPPYKIVAEEVKRIHSILTSHNVKMMIWADQFYESRNGGAPYYTAKATALIPRDIIMCEWNYGSAKEYPAISFFKTNGFEVIAAGWYRPGNVINFARSAYKNKILGYMGTTWGWVGPLVHMPSRTTAIVLTGEFTWSANHPKSLEDVAYNPATMFKKFADYSNLPLPGTEYNFYAVDLRNFVNTTLIDNDKRTGWMGWGPDYDLRSVPQSWTSKEGIPFRISTFKNSNILGAVVLASSETTNLPSKLTIPIHHHADTLVFLHATSKLKSGKRPHKVGEYRIVYEDNQIITVPLIFGSRGIEENINVGTWNDRYVCAQGFDGWSGYTKGGAHILLHGYSWKNPYPSNRIKQIIFTSSRTSLKPILFAITLQLKK